MAFGQPSGPPATARQLRELNALVEAAGHTGFKDARGPLGLNQRQAGGRFTQDEAAELITRLEAEAEVSGDSGSTPDSPAPERPGPARTPAASPTPAAAAPPAASRRQSLARQLERVPEDLLVDELRRRGWTVTSP
ncbi:MAG TPA: hypothetical protein VII96_12530 [Acidimicrobiales bacterium]